MSVSNLQQTRPYCQEIIYNLRVPSFDPHGFASWLQDAFRRSHYKSYSELADQAGLKRSTVSALATAKPQTATGNPSRPKSDTVERLAAALGEDIDNALLLAGHAPRRPMSSRRPETLAEFLEALKELVPEQFNFAIDKEKLKNFSPEEFQELLERIRADIEITLRRYTL